MSRWVPAPALSVLLLIVWLLLNAAVDPGTLLLGVAIAWAAPLLSAPLRPGHVRMRRPFVTLRLIATVLGDVVVSNVAVARRILGGRRGAPRSAFVLIPLDLRDASALAALAVITTIVPGTVWSELAANRTALLLHVFDVDDEARFIADYKDRYERPLMEIFQ